MQSALGSEHQKSGPSMPCALWPVDLKLTHLDWNPEATLIHFQGQYLTICEFDYNVLQGEIQNIPKTRAAVEIGEFCLVEDFTTCRWYRGRVQNRHKDLFDVFLIDHGNVLSVDIAHISSCSNDLFILPPKITTLLQQNEEMILPSSETRTQKAKEQSNLDTSTPQQLDFAPVDTDKAYSGFAAAVTTPFEFCVVLEDLLLVMNKVSIMLDDLPGQMPPLPEAHLVPNTCCLLKSDTKNKWCRAEIVHINNTAVFNLVDYGHHECIPYEDCAQLKRLPEEMTNLPKVTYPCILRGVKPVGEEGQWTDEAAVFFQQCLCQKNLQIFFREFVSNTHWKVDILADGIHVAKELVDAGHGNYMDIMLGLRFQEQSPHKAVCLHPDSEEECGQEDEDSDRKSQLSFEAPDKVEKMLLSTVSGTRQCLLM